MLDRTLRTGRTLGADRTQDAGACGLNRSTATSETATRHTLLVRTRDTRGTEVGESALRLGARRPEAIDVVLPVPQRCVWHHLAAVVTPWLDCQITSDVVTNQDVGFVRCRGPLAWITRYVTVSTADAWPAGRPARIARSQALHSNAGECS